MAKGMLFQIMSYKLTAEHGPVIGKQNFLPEKMMQLYLGSLHPNTSFRPTSGDSLLCDSFHFTEFFLWETPLFHKQKSP